MCGVVRQVALSAVSSCLALCAPLLDDQNTVEAAEAAARRANGAAAGATAGLVAALQLGDRGGANGGAGTLEDSLADEEQGARHCWLRRASMHAFEGASGGLLHPKGCAGVGRWG